MRRYLNREKIEKGTARGRAMARVSAVTAGRWELCRSRKRKGPEELVRDDLRRAVILCRETAREMSFGEALRVLRIWEYTGQARRGYYIAGLSGAQFMEAEAYEKITYALANPGDAIVWLNAADPAQVWGRILPHAEGRGFVCVPGTAVALHRGLPVCVFERQGQALRVFDDDLFAKALHAFGEAYQKKRIFAPYDRITVKEYPREQAAALREAGFSMQMNDFVLYRR